MEEFVSLEQYIQRISSLHCARINGRLIVAKPMLLVAIINGIEDGAFKENRFYWDTKSEQYRAIKHYYQEAFQGYTPNTYVTPIHKPFFHMNYDGFWHLKLKDGVRLPSSSSSGFLKENLYYAHFDDALWNMLQNQSNRDRILETIVDKYLKSC